MKLTKKESIKLIVSSAIFGALAIILYCFPALQFSLPFTPTFLKMHFDEIPIFVAGFCYGPIPVIIITIIKFLFKLIQDIGETGGIGATADVIYTLAFVLPAVLIYRKHRNFKSAIIGLSISLISQLLFSSVIGLYTIYPLFGFYYNPQASSYNEAMLTIGALFKVLDPSINSAGDPKVIYEFLIPFNLIKDVIVLGFTLIIYKPLKVYIERK